MIRTALVVAMLAFGATALVAQSDPIAVSYTHLTLPTTERV